MTMTLMTGPTALDRLETAITRMIKKHGFLPVDPDNLQFPAGLSALLLTDDPQRNLEVLDACVILPEALKALGEQVSCWVADHEGSAPWMRQFGVARAPAVVFLRDGQFVGMLNGIRDWSEYQNEVTRLLNGPAQPKPIGIPVRAEINQGACA